MLCGDSFITWKSHRDYISKCLRNFPTLGFIRTWTFGENARQEFPPALVLSLLNTNSQSSSFNDWESWPVPITDSRHWSWYASWLLWCKFETFWVIFRPQNQYFPLFHLGNVGKTHRSRQVSIRDIPSENTIMECSGDSPISSGFRLRKQLMECMIMTGACQPGNASPLPKTRPAVLEGANLKVAQREGDAAACDARTALRMRVPHLLAVARAHTGKFKWRVGYPYPASGTNAKSGIHIHVI